MNQIIPDGVWPTMVTPFTDSGALDEDALAAMVEWYLDRDVDGLFAVCQSSEMFHLSLAERLRLAERVVHFVDGRAGVIASGHVADRLEAQAQEVSQMAETGVDAVVLVTNRFAAPDEPDRVWQRTLSDFLDMIPADIPLGFYECPYPYKRLLSPKQLAWCAETDRFYFLKDTSCDLDQIKAKLDVAGEVKLYNANAATLLGSLRAGAAGYSGVMGNVHPELYVALCRRWAAEPKMAADLQAFLSVSSVIEARAYPVSAKYYLQLDGLPLTLQTRRRPASALTPSYQLEVQALRTLTHDYITRISQT